MNVLISIKPQYVEKIIKHEKLYEFRRKIFKQDVNRVIIYSTSPVKKIIGYFDLTEIIKDKPLNLWNNYSKYGGINKKDFFDYFEGTDEGFAIKISNLKLFSEEIDVSLLDNFKAPQSFKYITNEEFEELLSLKIVHQ